MNIHEFGKENNEIILLIHPSVVKWDYFENVIPLLQEKYHLLIPALPGYDFENDSDFTSVEQIASELNDWLSTRGYRNLYAVYGCSMGGSILGLTRSQVYQILRNPKYSHFFETIVIAEKKRITKENFQKCLEGQNQFHLDPANDYEELALGILHLMKHHIWQKSAEA